MNIICEENGLKVEDVKCGKRTVKYFFPKFTLVKREEWFSLTDSKGNTLTVEFSDVSNINLCGEIYDNLDDFETALEEIAFNYNSISSDDVINKSDVEGETVTDALNNSIEVLSFDNLAAFPVTGVEDKIYIDKATNLIYRWNGASYVAIGDGAGAGGDMMSVNNLSDVVNALTAFNNIKQNATEALSGVAEIATQVEVDAGLDDNRIVTPLKLAASPFGLINGVAESFPFALSETLNQALDVNLFYGWRQIITAGKYRTIGFYLNDVTAGVGESAILRFALYDSDFLLIDQISLPVDNSSPTNITATLDFGSDMVFPSPRLVYFVFGYNDRVGNFNVRSPRVDVTGAASVDTIFDYALPSGALPADISAGRNVSNRVFYNVLFKL